MLITRLLFLFVILMEAKQSHAALFPVDRLILEVETSSYTQRQFEIFYFIKQILLNRQKSPSFSLDQSLWEQELEMFKNEMLVNELLDREAQRLSSFYPTKKMIDTALEMIHDRQKNLPNATAILKKLDVKDEEVRRALTQILRVQSYLKSKGQMLLNPEQNESPLWGYQLDPQAEWFRRIAETFRYRFYEGARTYKKLNYGLNHEDPN